MKRGRDGGRAWSAVTRVARREGGSEAAEILSVFSLVICICEIEQEARERVRGQARQTQ